MPSCHLPEKNGARLQFSGLPQTQKKIGPVGPFPGGVGVDEKEIGHDGTKSTEHGDEGGLTDLFAQMVKMFEVAELERQSVSETRTAALVRMRSKARTKSRLAPA